MSTKREFIRYSIVGLLSNLTLFLVYLAATGAGIGPKSAMTFLYVIGVLMTFVFNRNWSFGHRGIVSRALVRYLLVYLVGYLVNWVTLYVLVDRSGWPHQLVQACMIVALAIALFLSQKYWVFKGKTAV